MQPFVIVIAALVFIAALGSILLIYSSFRSRESDRQAQIARRLGTKSEPQQTDIFQLRQQEASSSYGGISDRLESLLLQAGRPYDLDGLVSRIGGAALVGVLVLGVVFRSPLALVGVLAGAVPVLLLRSKARKRARRLSEQLPEALDLIARSLQAGHGLSDAMRLCAEEMKMPVAEEFARVFEEGNLGRDLRDSLHQLSARNPQNFDLKLFVSSVLLQRDTGGNLIEILNNIANTIRDRFVFEAKVRALTAEARFSAIILGGLPFALLGLIAFLRPSYLTPLFTDQLGHYLVAGGLTWFITGVFVMRTVSNVEV